MGQQQPSESSEFADPLVTPTPPVIGDLPIDHFFFVIVGPGISNLGFGHCDLSLDSPRGVLSADLIKAGPVDFVKPFLGAAQIDEFRFAVTCPANHTICLVDFQKMAGLRFDLCPFPGVTDQVGLRRIMRIPESMVSQLALEDLSFGGDDDVGFVVTNSKRPTIWSTAGDTRQAPEKIDEWQGAMALCENRGYLYSAGRPPTRRCFDLRTMKVVREANCQGQGDMYGGDYDPERDVVFMTRYNDGIAVMSGDTFEHVMMLQATTGMQDVVCVPEKNLACALGNSGSVLAYDIRRPDRKVWQDSGVCFPGGGNYSSLARFPPNSRGRVHIIGSSLHGTPSVAIWDVENHKKVESGLADWTRGEGVAVFVPTSTVVSREAREDEEERLSFLRHDMSTQGGVWVDVGESNPLRLLRSLL